VDEITISQSALKLSLALLGTLVFVCVGVILVTVDRTPKSFIVGLISIPFFGYLFVIGVRRVFDHGLDLIINDVGIGYRNWEYGQIAWGDIESIGFQKTRMFVKVKNISKYIERVSGVKKVLLGFDPCLRLSLIKINVANVALTPEKMIAILRGNNYLNGIKLIDRISLGTPAK
jgi:hypothetical protein